MVFVFGTIAEFALVLTITRRFDYSENSIYDSTEGFNGKNRQTKKVFHNDGNAEIKAFEAKIMRLNSMSKISDSNSKLSETNKTKMSHHLRITITLNESIIVLEFDLLSFSSFRLSSSRTIVLDIWPMIANL